MKKCNRFFLILLLAGYLGVYEGYLALWKNGSSVPDQVFPRPASIYPEKDYQELKKGIPYLSQESLTRLMEDFLS